MLKNAPVLIAFGIVCLLIPMIATGTTDWRPQGPAPITGGQVTGISAGEVVGAIHALAPHPQNADILYAGAVNGGVWKTLDARSASPSWVHQTDAQLSLSIGALEFDPTDVNFQTLAAGFGRKSSFGGVGGSLLGLIRTTNGGGLWQSADSSGDLTGRDISGVAIRADIFVVSVSNSDNFGNSEIGIFRSVNAGATWTQISDGDGSLTGLPGGVSYDLVGDPNDASILYTSILLADSVGGVNGVFKSTDTGASWSRVSDAAIDGLLLSGQTSNVELAVGPGNTVWLIIANNGTVAGLFRSADGGANWAAMDLPGTTILGIHPGGQASIHMSIAADPQFSNLVYVGGDRQDFPNQIGATGFTGRLFRGDSTQPSGSQWAHLTDSAAVGPMGGGTASGTGPHADSREMVFDANGEIIEADDGGVYRRTSPRNNGGDWLTMNGDLQVTELHDASWDSVAAVGTGGAQDTGTPSQAVTGGSTWPSVSTADGGDVAVGLSPTPGMSIRYSSFQTLLGFRRRVYNAANVLQSETFPALTVIGGGAALVPNFVTPVVANAAVPARLIFGGANSVYESLDEGSTITEIAPGLVMNSFGTNAAAYGATGNADMLYIGVGSDVYIRSAAQPAALTLSAAYPGSATIVGIAIDPDAPGSVFVADETSVYLSTDTGANWSNVTGNLISKSPGTLRSIAYMAHPAGNDGLAIGSDRGVYCALEIDNFSAWFGLGSGFPNAPVFDLSYDAAADLLFAGTLGRGAWNVLAPHSTDIVFHDGFE